MTNGKTVVNVIAKVINPNTGKRETKIILSEGIVVQQTSSFLRVYEPTRSSDPAKAEWFPKHGKDCKCVEVKELSEAISLPAAFFP